MNNIKYLEILNYICNYYDMDESELLDLLKKKENRFMLLLILKKNNCLNIYDIMSKFGVKNKRTIEKNIENAEERLLVNNYFRKEYFEIEKDIDIKINSKL